MFSKRFLSGINLGVLWKQSRIPDGVFQPNLTLRPSDGMLKKESPGFLESHVASKQTDVPIFDGVILRGRE